MPVILIPTGSDLIQALVHLISIGMSSSRTLVTWIGRVLTGVEIVKALLSNIVRGPMYSVRIQERETRQGFNHVELTMATEDSIR